MHIVIFVTNSLSDRKIRFRGCRMKNKLYLYNKNNNNLEL